MTDATQLAEILATVDGKPASYLSAARRIAEREPSADAVEVRLFVLATFTFDLILPYLVVEGARRGLRVAATVGPYGQLEQQALDVGSPLYAESRDVVMVAARIEDIAADLVDGFVGLPSAEIEPRVAAYVERIGRVCAAIRERTTARIVVWNQPAPRRLAAGLADTALETSQRFTIAEIGRRLATIVAAVPGAVVFDVGRLAEELGTRHWYDPKLETMSRAPFSAAAQLAIGKQLARTLRALVKPPCKCLVLDLDNTLWGGVLGEDGLAGIKLGDTHMGSVYKSFQRVIRSYRDRGILLAIASKNNESDVAELFETHSDMVLRRADFAATQIHWQDKASSLRAIAATLNIGVDALAFFDDNPTERAWVRAQLPDVTVIDVPPDPLGYIAALDDSGAFDALGISAEDRVRAVQYQSEAARRELEQRATSVEEFLVALGQKVSIGRIGSDSLGRVVQLLGKTNQFNVTTRRYSESELALLLADERTIGLWMRVADRYGDHGLVGVALAVPEASAYRIDTFLMSCRVLGRRVEHELLHAVARRARARGASVMLGEFIPTKKNAPAAGFFSDAGFDPIDGRDGWWRRQIETGIEPSEMFELIEEDQS